MRLLLTAVLVVAALYAAICVLAFVFQRDLLYPAPRGRRQPSAPGASLLELKAADGAKVYALHAPAPPGAVTVLHFHGNGEDLADEAWLISALRARGLGVLSV